MMIPSFETPADALAWMQRRHGLAKGTIEAASEPDPKDKPVEPEEGEDEPVPEKVEVVTPPDPKPVEPPKPA
jgi:hypothetical protein